MRKRIGDERLVAFLTRSFSPGRSTIRYGMLSLAFAVGVLALMNLQKPGAADGLSRKGIDVVIALDVSRSMLATDLPPNRLERAKQLITKLMNAMPDDRFALVVFAGKAYLQMPLTTDHGAAAMFVSSASPDAVPEQGTVIREALERSAAVFNGTERRFKAVILISDGEDHDEEAVKTATTLAEQGMMISTVGIGSPDGSYIPDAATGENKRDETGSQVISKLNEDELRSIASATRGVYIRLQESDQAVAQLQQQLSQIDSIALDDVSLVNYRTYYWWFAGAMLLLLIGEFFIPETRRSQAGIARPKKIKRKEAVGSGGETRKATSTPRIMMLMLLVMSFISFKSTVSAQQPGVQAREAIRRGNEFYRQQQYAQAEAAYAEASALDPADMTSKFNRANALYRQNKTTEAMRELDDLTFKSLDPMIKSKGYYNKGVMLSGQQKLDESIEAYKGALRLNAADKNARENLQKALKERQQQQPKPQDQPKPQPDKKKQQQQQQQPQMNKQEAEQRLKLLEQKEKEVQQRLQKEKSTQGGGLQKDW